MKERMKKWMPYAALLSGVVMLAAALWAGENVPVWVNGLLCGLGGAALGLGGSGLIMGWASRCLSPKDREELARAENDERNVSIREKAARDSWYWTGGLLWVPFVAALVLGEKFFIVLAAGVIVLHNGFFLLNMARWSHKM